MILKQNLYPLLSVPADYFDLRLSEAEVEQISSLNRNERRFGNPARFP